VAKKKLLALCLGLVLLLSSGLSPVIKAELVVASPEKMEWSIVDTPCGEGNVVVSPGEINAFVVGSDDETFYAIDIPNGLIYKSIDAGVTWEDDLTDALIDEGAALPAWDIAVAPDDAKLLAVVTDDRQEVYVSEDGGETWVDTGVSNTAGWEDDLLIADIDISLGYNGDRDIAIGTRNPDGSPNGDVWVIKSGIFAGWESQGLEMDVTSVRFSPGYPYDKTILAIASDSDKTYLCTGVRSITDNSTDWDVTEPSKVEINEVGEDSPGENEIIFSTMALPADYSGDDEVSRVLYVSYSSNTTADDVYRIKDIEVTRMDVKHGHKVPVASIAYHGTCSGGKLLMGEVLAEADSASALVHLCSNPEEKFPKWMKPAKPPTGGAVSGCANAQVAWSSDGEAAYCGTSTNYVKDAADWADTSLPGAWSGSTIGEPDESAFSISEDNGYIWNQLSIIDTEMSCLCDYALSADYKTLYLASTGSGFDSLWRSRSGTLGEVWQRVLCFSSETDDIILRSPPEKNKPEAVFFAVVDSKHARYSVDEGQTWKFIWDCPHITDMAVVNNEMFYILDDNLVNKCTWNKELYGGIWEWDMDIETELIHGYSIAASGEDFVFVGDNGDEGKIAYSTDGGVTFELTEAVPEPGKMVVLPDEDFDRNRFIYAASDDSLSGIYRWAIEGSTSWRKLNPRHLGFCGLAQREGALYGAYDDREGVARTLIPHLETIKQHDWDSLTVGLVSGVTFRAGTLRAMTDDAVDLWAIDDNEYFNGDISQYDDEDYNTVGRLWVYSDIYVLATPWPTSPAIGELISCDPCGCRAETFFFRWRELPLTERYDLWIALDEEFAYVIIKAENITPVDICNPAWSLASDSFRLGCGQTYYWKVRGCAICGGARVHSRWSPPVRFIVKTASAAGGMHVAPVLVAPEIGSEGVSRSPGFSWRGFPHATKYEFILARDADLTQVVAKEEVPASAYIYHGKLDWGATYFWQVRAIEPVPSEPSDVGVFTVIPEQPAAAAPPAIPPVTTTSTPLWIWLIIGILTLLVAIVIVLCLVKR